MTARPGAMSDKADLFLLFRLGDDRYALSIDDVGEILPLLDIKALPGSPAAIAGLINYRGAPVPVVDLNAMTLGRPYRPRLSTRILLTPYDAGDGVARWLGLIAEQATQVVRRPASDFVPADVDNPETPYLGPVAADAGGLIQRVDPAKLLSREVCDMLFRSATAA